MHLKSWRLHLRASRLVGRGDYPAASAIYQQLAASAPDDELWPRMLVWCYEREGRHHDAFPIAQAVVRACPGDLLALQTAARIAVAVEEYDSAAEYVRQALAFRQIRTEIPDDLRPWSTFLKWIARGLRAIPIFGRRVPRNAFADFEPGARAKELLDWKRWAEDFLAWHERRDPPIRDERVH